jgi:type IV pilus assembly protein PilA
MKQRYQQGFTLIELMIVVAIIGILAAIAIPSYNDYTARSQVSEGVSLLSGTKTPLAEYFADKGVWPTYITTVSSSVSGKYVSVVRIKSGTSTTLGITIEAGMKNSGVNSAIQGDFVQILTADGGKTWACGVGTGMAAKYVPGACK